jgi:hypothetical protein
MKEVVNIISIWVKESFVGRYNDNYFSIVRSTTIRLNQFQYRIDNPLHVIYRHFGVEGEGQDALRIICCYWKLIWREVVGFNKIGLQM